MKKNEIKIENLDWNLTNQPQSLPQKKIASMWGVSPTLGTIPWDINNIW